MTKIKVAVAGCLGRMGQEITKKILNNNKLSFVGGFEHQLHPNINKKLNKITDINSDFVITSNADQIINKSSSLKSVLEPFSSKGNLDLLKRAGFKDTICIFKYACFEGILAIK